MIPIALYNHITYSLSVGIVVSAIVHSSRKKHILATILVFVSGLLLAYIIYSTMVFTTILLTVFYAHKTKKYRLTCYQCLTAIFSIWFVTAFIASTIMVIAPRWHGGVQFNLFMGLAILVFSIILKGQPKIIEQFRGLERVEYGIILESLIILFFSFILPMFPIASIEDKRRWGLFFLAFLIFVLAVAASVMYAKNVEHERKAYRLLNAQQQEHMIQTDRQFKTYITLRHHFFSLIRSLVPFIRNRDMDGLEKHFNQYISPIDNDSALSTEQLDRIQNKIIRHMIEDMAGQAIQGGIQVNLSVDGFIGLDDALEMDVFKLLSYFLGNALDSLKNQDLGMLRIEMSGTDGLSIIVANTIDTDLDIEDLYNSSNRDRSDIHGHGLKNVREIVMRHPDMEHFTYKSGIYNGKKVFHQHIKIQ